MDKMSWVPTSSRPWSSGRIINQTFPATSLAHVVDPSALRFADVLSLLLPFWVAPSLGRGFDLKPLFTQQQCQASDDRASAWQKCRCFWCDIC
jgi:hypothetical protein